MTGQLFDIAQLSFSYGNREVLRGIDLSIGRGDFVGVIGPNGVGKSTLLHLMSGWLKPRAGSVAYKGRAVREWPRRAFAQQVGVVAQREEGLFPFTAEEVVLMGRYAHQAALAGFDDPEDHAIARGVLELVGLKGMEKRRLAELSGGERQRVFIARALAQCPEVLLLDEPTSSLDLSFQRDVFRLLERLNREHALTVFVVTHDINLAALFCRTLIVMGDGTIREQGAPRDLLRQDLLHDVYHAPIEILTSGDGTPVVVLRK